MNCPRGAKCKKRICVACCFSGLSQSAIISAPEASETEHSDVKFLAAERTEEQLRRKENSAPLSKFYNELVVEQNKKRESVIVWNKNARRPENRQKSEQGSASEATGSSSFGVGPVPGISESQSVEIPAQIPDPPPIECESVVQSGFEPEPATSGRSGKKLKRKLNSDSAQPKKKPRNSKRKATENQDKYYRKGVCKVCKKEDVGNIYGHRNWHRFEALNSENQQEGDLIFIIEIIDGFKTLVRVPKPDGYEEEPLKLYYCDFCEYYTYRKEDFKKHIMCQHFPAELNSQKCEFCPKSFATEQQLKQHVYRIHDEKWECRECKITMAYDKMRYHKTTKEPSHEIVEID